MDAGLAGLVGALGGGFIGATGAWGAALIAFKGARYQADRQGNAAHEQWLRQLRRDACLALIEEARALGDRLSDCPLARGQELQDAVAEVLQARQRLRKAYQALELEASDDLLLPAKEVALSGQSTVMVYLMADSPSDSENELRSASIDDVRSLDRSLVVFVECCRKALHEPAPLDQSMLR